MAKQDPKAAAQFLTIQQAIAAIEKEQLQLIQATNTATEKQAAAISAQYDKIDKTRKALKESAGFASDFADATADASKYQAQVANQAKDIFKSTNSQADISKSIVTTTQLLVKVNKSGNKELIAGVKHRLEQLRSDKQALKIQDQSKKALSGINDAVGKNIDSVNEFVGKLPGGSMISKMFGLDVLKKGFSDALSKVSADFMAAAASSGGLNAGIKAGKAAMMGFNATVLLNPLALIAAAAIGLLMTFKNVSHTAHELSTATGLTYAQTKKMVKASNDVLASSGNQLSLQKDILAVMTETVKEFGVMGMMSAKQAGAVSDIGIAFGYGAEQAGKVNNAFMRMGATADEAANTQRDLAAEAMKAGVSVGAVTADIAENSKATSKYFGGNVKALKKAAIEAAKMGVSLSTMAKVSDGLLDFEKSISAQFELQALTGKNMNLDGARRLALEGDIAGATAAVLDQVGSIAEFDNMSYLGRKKLAEATGMDVDELQKSLIIKSKMGNLDSAQLATMNGLGLSAAEMTNMSSEDLQKKLASKQATEKMAAQFAAMKATLVNALMPAAEAMMSAFVMLSPVLKGIGALMGVILAPLKAMGDILSGNTSEMSVFQKVLGGIVIAMTGLKLTTLAINGYYAAGNALAAMRGTLTNKEYIQKVAIGGLEKAGNVLKTFGNFLMGTRVTTAAALTAAEGKSIALKATGNVAEKSHLASAGATKIGQYIAEKAHLVSAGVTKVGQYMAEKAHLAFSGAMKIGQYAMAGAHWIAEKAHLGIKIALEQGALAIQFAINAAKMIGNVIAAGAIVPLMAAAGASIAAAIPAIFTGLGMIPFGLGIPIAFAAVAGLIGLVASMSKGDDVMSGPAGGGGGGYGSRVLFGPEGAISFNNKDTIVAGTDLFGQANDAVFAPKGALRMNDGAINADMPDPPEAKIVGIANQSVVKLSMGIAAAMGLAVAPAFMSALALSMPLITISIVGAIVAASALTMPMLATTIIIGFSAALIAAMPIIAATIVGAAVTAAAMTALIPKPVMILNPVLPTFETNPVMMMGAMLGGIGNLLGGGKDKGSTEDPIIAKLDQVIIAIQSMEINMDGQKVGALTRLADTFRKG